MKTSKSTVRLGAVMAMIVLLGGLRMAEARFGQFLNTAKKAKRLVDKKDNKDAKDDSKPGKAAPKTEAKTSRPGVGKIVFSTSPIDAANPANLTNTFKAGDRVYAVIYCEKPLKEIAGGSSKAEFTVKTFLNGKLVYSKAGFLVNLKKDALEGKTFVMDIAPEPAKMTAYKNPNVIYQKKFDKYGKKGGAMQLTKFISTLPPGKHTLKFLFYRYADLAEGEFEIDGDFKSYADLFNALEAETTKSVTMPKPKKSDKKLEAEMAKVLKNSQVDWARKGKILRVVIINPDWFIVRHKISGKVLHRYIQTDVIIKDPAGDCWIMRKTSFRQNYIGGKFQPLKLHGVMTGSGSKTKIPCDKVK